MATYLFTWNPARWSWDYFQDSIDQLKSKGYCSERWSCGVTKRIRKGDRAFLIKLGKDPRGIIASGWITRDIFEDNHWSEEKADSGCTAFYVGINWDTLLDPNIKIFHRFWLDRPIFSKMHWDSQASGVTIPDDVAQQLEKDWAKFLNRTPIVQLPLAEEIDPDFICYEGAKKTITINAYERNSEARAICILHHGLKCHICNFNFTETYGELGAGFIHVHHIQPLAKIAKDHQLNPIKDLRPVCPNCHAMLHRKDPCYSIEELKAIIAKRK